MALNILNRNRTPQPKYKNTAQYNTQTMENWLGIDPNAVAQFYNTKTGPLGFLGKGRRYLSRDGDNIDQYTNFMAREFANKFGGVDWNSPDAGNAAKDNFTRYANSLKNMSLINELPMFSKYDLSKLTPQQQLELIKENDIRVTSGNYRGSGYSEDGQVVNDPKESVRIRFGKDKLYFEPVRNYDIIEGDPGDPRTGTKNYYGDALSNLGRNIPEQKAYAKATWNEDNMEKFLGLDPSLTASFYNTRRGFVGRPFRELDPDKAKEYKYFMADQMAKKYGGDWKQAVNNYERYSGTLQNMAMINELPMFRNYDLSKLTPQQQLELVRKYDIRANMYDSDSGDWEDGVFNKTSSPHPRIRFGNEKLYFEPLGEEYAEQTTEGDTTYASQGRRGDPYWQVTGRKQYSGFDKSLGMAASNLMQVAGPTLAMTGIGTPLAALAFGAGQGLNMANQARASMGKGAIGGKAGSFLGAGLSALGGNYGAAAMQAGQGVANLSGNQSLQQLMSLANLLYGARGMGSNNTFAQLGSGLSTLGRGVNLYNQYQNRNRGRA